MYLTARSEAVFLSTWLICNGNKTFPMTVFHGISLKDWKTKPSFGPGFGWLVPSIRISPESGGISPSMSFKSVVLPDPEGPIITTNSFSSTLIERSSMTLRVVKPFPCRSGKDFERFRTTTLGANRPSRVISSLILVAVSPPETARGRTAMASVVVVVAPETVLPIPSNAEMTPSCRSTLSTRVVLTNCAAVITGTFSLVNSLVV